MKVSIKDFCEQCHVKPSKIEIRGRVTILTTDKGTFCLKPKDETRQDISTLNVYEYLNSRSFYYYPRKLDLSTDEVEVREYIREDHIPREQKIVDLVDLMSLLHNKTTHYKEVDLDEVKDEFFNKVDSIKSELEELDKEKVLKIAKQKGEELKKKTEELVKLAKEKGTPVLENVANEVREKAIVVVKDVLDRLEKSK